MDVAKVEQQKSDKVTRAQNNLEQDNGNKKV